MRPDGITTPRQLTAAYDDKGRRIAEAPLPSRSAVQKGTAHFNLPVELRNDFRLIRVDGMEQAGATRLIDAGSQRRTVGLIASGDGDLAQPLLSPLHYISRALSPYANLVEPRSADLLQSVPEVLDAKPSVLIMADIGTFAGAGDRAAYQMDRKRRHAGPLCRTAPLPVPATTIHSRPSNCARVNVRSAATLVVGTAKAARLPG